MKFWNVLSLLTLGLLLACSTTNKVAEVHSFKSGTRSIASVDEMMNDFSPNEINETIKEIFHSYLLGQVRLNEFDKSLDQNSGEALESDTYHELQAIRMMVDGYEEEISDYYVKLVLVKALPNYTQIDKIKAVDSLKMIDAFLNGEMNDEKEIPENLRPMILGNLGEKQSLLHDELKALRNDISITNNDIETISVINEQMEVLKNNSKNFANDATGTSSYVVNPKILDETLEQESKTKRFQKFKAKIKSLGAKIKSAIQKMKNGRSTSSDSIYASTTTAGNINGSKYPANTWSLTYDDGPGNKTSATILKNLQDRNMKATFFFLARQVEVLPTISKNIANAGMDIASHSYSHPEIPKLGPAALEKQVGGSKKIIEESLNKKLKLFRLPYGSGVKNTSVRAKIAEHDMIHVSWNVDTLDWQDKNPASIFKRTVRQMNQYKKGIVLFHDIHKQSVTASTMLMDYFIEQKHVVCTVQGVVDQMNKGLATCQD